MHIKWFIIYLQTTQYLQTLQVVTTLPTPCLDFLSGFQHGQAFHQHVLFSPHLLPSARCRQHRRLFTLITLTTANLTVTWSWRRQVRCIVDISPTRHQQHTRSWESAPHNVTSSHAKRTPAYRHTSASVPWTWARQRGALFTTSRETLASLILAAAPRRPTLWQTSRVVTAVPMKRRRKSTSVIKCAFWQSFA